MDTDNKGGRRSRVESRGSWTDCISSCSRPSTFGSRHLSSVSIRG